jgi:hypothetical protein
MDVNRTVFGTFAPVEFVWSRNASNSLFIIGAGLFWPRVEAAGAHFLNLDACPRSGTRSNGNHCSQVDEAPSNA